MNSFHIVCGRKKGGSKKRLKVLIWKGPLKIKIRRDIKIRKLQVNPFKRNNIRHKIKVVTFVRHPNT